jgi:hypothetical protein
MQGLFYRWRIKFIAEMSTQMTAPWPTACAAIEAKMHAGTMLKWLVKNA